MIDKTDIASFERFKYDSPFTGSYKGMRFRIVHPKKVEGQEDVIHVDVYPGPYCFEKTPDELKVHTTYPFSVDGYEEIVSYLNRYYEENMDKWEENLGNAMKRYDSVK